MCFYVSLWGKKKSVRPWVFPLMHIIRVFLETSRPFCCHWSCSNRVCLSMQSSGEGCQGGISSQQLTRVQHAHLTLQCWASMVLASEAALLGRPVLMSGNAFELGAHLGWDSVGWFHQRKRESGLEDTAKLLLGFHSIWRSLLKVWP